MTFPQERYSTRLGWLTPTWDENHVITRRIKQAEEAAIQITEFCHPHKRRVAIQAGGSWGPWPLAFSEIFDTVYTFEPDSECFCCLTANTAHKDNVIRIQAALGEEDNFVKVVREKGSTGSQKTDFHGDIPLVMLDDLCHREDVDLIYLDTEGSEFEALLGAEGVIVDNGPVIAFEDRPFPTDHIKTFLKGYGYREAGRIGHDCVMVC